MATKEQINDAWHDGPGDAIEQLYDGELTDFEEKQITIFTSEFTPEQLVYHNASKELLEQINILKAKLKLNRPDYVSAGSDANPGYNSLIDNVGRWPDDNPDHAFYSSTVIPVFLEIIEDLKVMQENILISDSKRLLL